MKEQINVPEFSWYEMGLNEEVTGVPVRLVVSGHDPYLDELGPRIRVDLYNSINPLEMIPIYILSPDSNINILPKNLCNLVLKFISKNKDNILMHWIHQSDNYTSSDFLHNIVKV